MLETAFTRLVGCGVPIQLAAMGGGVTSPELVSAVSRAGGVGMLQRGGTRPLLERMEEIERTGGQPYGVNFVPPLGQGTPEEVERASSRARLVEFFWSDPDPAIVEIVHAGGALASWQVGSVEEAKRAADAGCDVIVAQGIEAGGHVRGTIGLLPLLAAVLDAVAVPVVAAGAIATSRSMAAALAAGAAAVRIGTRFLATTESGAHPEYVAALLAAGPGDTVMTKAFSIGWPDAQHRVLASAVAAAEGMSVETIGLVVTDSGPQSVQRWAARTPSREVSGAIHAMALYAGEGVGQVDEVVGASLLAGHGSRAASPCVVRSARRLLTQLLLLRRGFLTRGE
jgi:nitronate monooxygenase